MATHDRKDPDPDRRAPAPREAPHERAERMPAADAIPD